MVTKRLVGSVCLTKSYKLLESFGRKDHRLIDRQIGLWLFPKLTRWNFIEISSFNLKQLSFIQKLYNK